MLVRKLVLEGRTLVGGRPPDHRTLLAGVPASPGRVHRTGPHHPRPRRGPARAGRDPGGADDRPRVDMAVRRRGRRGHGRRQRARPRVDHRPRVRHPSRRGMWRRHPPAARRTAGGRRRRRGPGRGRRPLLASTSTGSASRQVSFPARSVAQTSTATWPPGTRTSARHRSPPDQTSGASPWSAPADHRMDTSPKSIGRTGERRSWTRATTAIRPRFGVPTGPTMTSGAAVSGAMPVPR